MLRVHTYDDRDFSAILATVPPFFSICGIELFLADWFIVFSMRIWQIFTSSILAAVIYFEKFSFWVRNWAVTCIRYLICTCFCSNFLAIHSISPFFANNMIIIVTNKMLCWLWLQCCYSFSLLICSDSYFYIFMQLLLSSSWFFL